MKKLKVGNVIDLIQNDLFDEMLDSGEIYEVISPKKVKVILQSDDSIRCLAEKDNFNRWIITEDLE